MFLTIAADFCKDHGSEVDHEVIIVEGSIPETPETYNQLHTVETKSTPGGTVPMTIIQLQTETSIATLDTFFQTVLLPSVTFCPVSVLDQKEMCAHLDVPFIRSICSSDHCIKNLGFPTSHIRITGDGNCLFNAVAMCIAGGEQLSSLAPEKYRWKILRCIRAQSTFTADAYGFRSR